MKKGLIFLLGIISFLGMNSVSADTISASDFYTYFEVGINAYSEYEENINYMINYWKENYSATYPYYVISYNSNNSIYLYCASDLKVIGSGNSLGLANIAPMNPDSRAGIYYDIDSDSYKTNIYNSPNLMYVPLMSNGNLFFDNSRTNYPDFDKVLFPIYKSDTLDLLFPEFEISTGENFPTIVSLYDGSYIPNITDTYKEINLNDYSYVILSLKDYTPRDTFTSTMYVKGQLCPTTVYNYGLEEKKDYVSGYQTQNCGYYYNNFVPSTTYIRAEDINHHAIYYLTGYDFSKPNLVKVDTSIFDITYITSENENEPYAFINGKNYPVLPYSSLTDTATLTEKNGVSDTWTCAKYDTDCFLNSSAVDFNDLFEKPLEFFKNIRGSITSIFDIITEFISLLPDTMQSFLYLSFMIAIILGILKIIL